MNSREVRAGAEAAPGGGRQRRYARPDPQSIGASSRRRGHGLREPEARYRQGARQDRHGRPPDQQRLHRRPEAHSSVPHHCAQSR